MSCSVLRSMLLVYLALCGLYVLPAWTSGGLPPSVTSMTETLLFVKGAGCAGAAMLQQPAGHEADAPAPDADSLKTSYNIYEKCLARTRDACCPES